MKNTNGAIALKVCQAHPESKYANLLGYDGNSIDASKLDLFVSHPDIANEFLSDMANTIVAQYAYDALRGYKMPFTRFLKSVQKLGDAEQYVTAELQSVGNYDGTDTSPFSTSKPSVVVSYLKTEEKKRVKVTLNYDIWAGAFISEGGLNNLAGIILKNMRDAVDIYMYEKLTALISDAVSVPKYAVFTSPVTAVGETSNARDCYEEIMQLVNKMQLPSSVYNKAGKKTITPAGKFVLVLNASYKASFDMNVLASLFHSDKIGKETMFADVILVDFADADTCVGVILDEEALVWGYRINTTTSIMNPATLDVNTFLHQWVKYGILPVRNAVRLLTTGDGEETSDKVN